MSLTFYFFFFNDTATTEIYTLSLHDALPIYLDAFKACHQLTLAVHRLAKKLEERDATLSGHLWAAALCASSRIARGSAFRNRRMFAACVDRTLSALSEISYYLDMGYAMGLISKEDHQEIESLGGRALFYSMKLVMSLAGGS